jgi:osmoprotectant transport system substrate-binding protein
MKSFSQLIFVSLIVALLLAAGGKPAAACVGKTLVVGALETPQQQILTQLLSVLISERTGTTVKIVAVKDHQAAHQAIQRAELDMYVEYTGIGQVELLKDQPIAEAEALYAAVKERYNQELNLIWLKPFGFVNPSLAPAGTVAEAAPVVRKDTLKKFPALARLINKLGGAVDNAAIEQLEAESVAGSPRDVARRFLRKHRFI